MVVGHGPAIEQGVKATTKSGVVDDHGYDTEKLGVADGHGSNIETLGVGAALGYDTAKTRSDWRPYLDNTCFKLSNDALSPTSLMSMSGQECVGKFDFSTLLSTIWREYAQTEYKKTKE